MDDEPKPSNVRSLNEFKTQRFNLIDETAPKVRDLYQETIHIPNSVGWDMWKELAESAPQFKEQVSAVGRLAIKVRILKDADIMLVENNEIYENDPLLRKFLGEICLFRCGAAAEQENKTRVAKAIVQEFDRWKKARKDIQPSFQPTLTDAFAAILAGELKLV